MNTRYSQRKSEIVKLVIVKIKNSTVTSQTKDDIPSVLVNYNHYV